MTNNKKLSQVEMFRRFMPKQFARQTKLCPHCGNRLQHDRGKGAYLVCKRCKREY